MRAVPGPEESEDPPRAQTTLSSARGFDSKGGVVMENGRDYLRNPGEFDRWFKANDVLASIWAIAILMMALGGLNSARLHNEGHSILKCHCVEMRASSTLKWPARAAQQWAASSSPLAYWPIIS